MPAVNDVSVLQPQEEVGLVRDVHLSADGLDEVEGCVVDVRTTDWPLLTASWLSIVTAMGHVLYMVGPLGRYSRVPGLPSFCRLNDT